MIELKKFLTRMCSVSSTDQLASIWHPLGSLATTTGKYKPRPQNSESVRERQRPEINTNIETVSVATVLLGTNPGTTDQAGMEDKRRLSGKVTAKVGAKPLVGTETDGGKRSDGAESSQLKTRDGTGEVKLCTARPTDFSQEQAACRGRWTQNIHPTPVSFACPHGGPVGTVLVNSLLHRQEKGSSLLKMS